MRAFVASLPWVAVALFGGIGQTFGTTLYHVVLHTSECPNTGAQLVLELVSDGTRQNSFRVFNFVTDGQRGTGSFDGGPAFGGLVTGEAVSSPDATVQNTEFMNRLTIPMTAAGSTTSFTVEVTEYGAQGSSAQDQLSFYYQWTGPSEWLSTQDPQGADALFAVNIDGQPGGSLEVFAPSVVQVDGSIQICIPGCCGGGGCPFVDTRTTVGWQVENTILGRSVTDTTSLDAYRLRYAPEVKAGRVQVRLREDEQEYTKLDEVRLVAVDHAQVARAFALGDRIVVGRRVAAAKVTTAAGADVTKLVSGGAEGFYGGPGDTLFVTMVGSGLGPTLRAQATEDGGGLGDGGFDEKQDQASPRTGARTATPVNLDEVILASTGVLVQKPDGEGGWRTVVHYYPREYQDDALFDSLDSGQARLVFVGKHGLHFFGWVEVLEDEPTIQTLTLLGAEHSRLGGVKTAVGQSGGTTTSLAPGDTITFTFASPPIPLGRARDLFLMSRGVYSSIRPLTNERGGDDRPMPRSFVLHQNLPNPFSGATTIRFETPIEINVRLQVFDAQGRLVRTLTDARFPAGFQSVEWDQRDQTGKRVGSGIYLCRIRAGRFWDQMKMVVVP